MVLNIARLLNYTVFAVLAVVLACLIILTPADAIYQCYITQRLTNIFIITGGYVATFLLAALIYATRIYTNRTVLSGIPKAWIPIEKDDVGKSVRRLVKEGLVRSAIIAYQARPRDLDTFPPTTATSSTTSVPATTHTPTPAAVFDDNGTHETFADYESSMALDVTRPPWGHVEHPGWSSPSCRDLPDLPYRTVIQELPNLIEAKAVSLAPPDPILTDAAARYRPRHPLAYQEGQQLGEDEEGEENEPEESQEPIPDTRVVEILRRPASMGLREYFNHLATLNMINPPEVGAEFLALYERARFSGRELYEAEFRDLMHVFAEVLRGMQLQDPHVLEEIQREGGGDGGGGKNTTRADTESLIGPSDEEGETDAQEFYNNNSRHDVCDYDGENDAEQRRVDYYGRGRSGSLRPVNQATWDPSGSRWVREEIPRTPSMRSLRPVTSNVSGSSVGSVIRLVDAQGSDLPYIINRGR